MLHLFRSDETCHNNRHGYPLVVGSSNPNIQHPICEFVIMASTRSCGWPARRFANGNYSRGDAEALLYHFCCSSWSNPSFYGMSSPRLHHSASTMYSDTQARHGTTFPPRFLRFSACKISIFTCTHHSFLHSKFRCVTYDGETQGSTRSIVCKQLRQTIQTAQIDHVTTDGRWYGGNERGGSQKYKGKASDDGRSQTGIETIRTT